MYLECSISTNSNSTISQDAATNQASASCLASPLSSINKFKFGLSCPTCNTNFLPDEEAMDLYDNDSNDDDDLAILKTENEDDVLMNGVPLLESEFDDFITDPIQNDIPVVDENDLVDPMPTTNTGDYAF